MPKFKDVLAGERVHFGRKSTGKGIVAGALGGLIGTIVMTQFQSAWSSASKAVKDNKENAKRAERQPSDEEKENATMKLAGKIGGLAGRQLSHQQKSKFAPLVHYGFGTLQGGLYGLALERARRRGGVLPALIFGASLFAAADELAVPALGLSAKPSKSPLSLHLYGLAAHLVYGLATDVGRRGVRGIF